MSVSGTPTRREALKFSGLLGVLAGIGLLSPTQVLASSDPAFAAKSLEDALKLLGATPTPSADILLTSPDIAENGAVVQVGVQSKLPATQEIHLLVEKNVNPLVASFTLNEGVAPFVQTRVRMGQSTLVWALVKADGRWYSASKESKVTLGGCGG
ncbi:thiosulfate oxidation carrier protein SoxY [uncultured Sphaerotilus sp.]|uniref:thiosulfate oxidation carrier protein SoxY n=1 Tax=uncultured Sphaerotilus sp. TaxID=474984 RepID=UPI0030CA2C4C